MTASPSVKINIQASDDSSGIAGYYLSTSSIQPSLSDFINVTVTSKFSKSISDSFSIEEKRTYYVWFIDVAGNMSGSVSKSIEYDQSIPYNITISIEGGNSTTTSKIVQVTISAEDSGAGIAGYYISNTSTPPSLVASGWVNFADANISNSYSATVFHTLIDSTPGSKSVYVWFKDKALNLSYVKGDSITLLDSE